MDSAQARLRVFAEHRLALIDYAAPIVGSRDAAEDVVQEAYFRFVPAQPADRTTIPAGLRVPAAYLYRIVRNLALDWTRRDKAEQRRDAAYAEIRDPMPVTASPEEERLCEEEVRRVLAALHELPDAKRRAYEMKIFGELSLPVIAERLGVSRATAHRMVRDALIHVMRRVERLAVPDATDEE
ncbi:sigma-70 family RNA polymerase sigma factor [Sandaracinobacter sp. RS1-74]|uniref:sigma-70 family RNA polymerase sigma factor n=1 Tax=Sandaracinobacteroides sayramensis TaxID=2913411 RepID=UPI001EDB2AF8|nr:sigma-70 family RNA polymerase sigma factor [Sandaracinobacteroides sayramensis]MCG2840689.1 sigma-70 family RNA polymerase sigma factor [Sandaracinobacteroides sayramensis]